MIGNHCVNMADYTIQPLEDGDGTQTQVETSCSQTKYIQMRKRVRHRPIRPLKWTEHAGKICLTFNLSTDPTPRFQ